MTSLTSLLGKIEVYNTASRVLALHMIYIDLIFFRISYDPSNTARCIS